MLPVNRSQCTVLSAVVTQQFPPRNHVWNL